MVSVRWPMELMYGADAFPSRFYVFSVSHIVDHERMRGT
jgi:hypothetical protein